MDPFGLDESAQFHGGRLPKGERVMDFLRHNFVDQPVEPLGMPFAAEVLFASIEIMQERVTRSRLAGEPPDFIISPHLAHHDVFD